MKTIHAVLILLVLIAGVLPAQAATVDDDAARLEASASWGVDLATGQIAIDPSLIVYSDADSGTIVINPKHAAAAAEALNARERGDGSFLLPDGSVVTPILGQLAIRVGNEPDGLLEDSGLPLVDIAKVRLMAPVSDPKAVEKARAARDKGVKAWIGQQRTRSWHKCSGCNACPKGCIGLSFYQGNNYKPCAFSWPWNSCTEKFDFRCRRTDFYCRDCTGDIVGESASVDWSCGSC